jgi:hypothetical protein
MQSPATFREYAEECKRLAISMPQHAEALLQMADAWIACAQTAEAKEASQDLKRRDGERSG